MKPIKLSELVNTLEFDSTELVTRIDLQKGCMVTVEDCVISAVEEDDEETLSELSVLEKQEVEIARAIVEDVGQRFLEPPDKFEFHEYRQMERFIGTVDNAEAAEQLWRAIKGNGAFRYFKDTATHLGLLDQWFRYRDEAMKQFVIDWAEANNVTYEDDLKARGHK